MIGRMMTVREMLDILNSDNNSIPDNVIIRELTPGNMLDFLIALEINHSIKSITINKITDPENIDVDAANSFLSVTSENTTLKQIDFGENVLPGKIAKPFIKAFGRFELESINIRSNDESINDRLVHYQKVRTWLSDVYIYFLNKYINESRKYNEYASQLKLELDKLSILTKYDKPSIKEIEEIMDHYQSSHPGIERFDKLKDQLDKMKSYCSIDGNTPIYFLVYEGMIDDIQSLYNLGYKDFIYELNDKNENALLFNDNVELDSKLRVAIIDMLVKLGFDVNAVDKRGFAAIHHAVASGSVDMIRALHKYGADVNKKTVFGYTPLNLAKTYNKEDDPRNKELERLGAVSPNQEKILSKREMFYIFGVKKIEHTIKEKMLSGGFVKEGFATLIKYFEKFSMETHYLNMQNAKEKFDRITKVLQSGYENSSLTIDEMIHKINHLSQGEKQLFGAGFYGHIMGMSIERKQNGDFTLSLTDRGFFTSRYYTQVSNKKYKTVKQLTVPSDAITQVLKLIEKANQSNDKIASSILFEEIPKLSGNSYVDHPHIEQSGMKTGLCYFGNPLTLLYLELMNEFGQDNPIQAIEMFKRFTIYMREQARSAYEPFAEAIDQLLMDESQRVIDEKESAFKIRFSKD